jgi:hypothetical protein
MKKKMYKKCTKKRLHSPNSMRSRTCSGEATIPSRKPATYIPLCKYEGNRVTVSENWQDITISSQ